MRWFDSKFVAPWGREMPSLFGASDKKSSGSVLRKLLALHWTSPFKGLPHGLSGCASLVSGALIVHGSLSGSFAAVRSSVLPFYCLATAANALAGYLIAGRAPSAVRVFFEHAAMFQVCLVYYALRFSHLWPSTWPLATSAADMLLGVVATPLGILSFVVSAFAKLPLPVAVSVLFGSFALALLALYPLHLALGGEEWWQCVQDVYPQQSVGMVGYIYVPATVTFSAMLFGATLLLRRVIGELVFGSVFLGLVLATLVSTVLMQEVHIPVVSTQRLYLPCPLPPAGSYEDAWVQRLDTSLLAQAVLGRLRQMGVSLPPPVYTR